MPCLQGPHAQCLRCSDCPPVKPFRKTSRGEELLAARYQLGLVEEREMNLRIMTERAFLEATGPAANAAPQRCCRHRESSG